MQVYSVSVRDEAEHARRARQFAAQLGAQLLPPGAPVTADFHIEFDRRGARLTCAALSGYAPLRIRFERAAQTSAADPLRKAVGAAATVVDATAGWGADAARLAAWGWRVTAVEREPLVAALLQHAHALCRDEELKSRLSVVHADSVEFLATAAADEARAPEVVYLDPMYPPQTKSAAAKKPLAMLRQLAGPPGDGAPLFEAAMASARRRVVVKRPHRAPPLYPGKVGETAGKLTRFDIYKPGGR